MIHAILIIDLDRFKPVNDILGHAAGDLVLREIAARLGDVVRKGDTIARLGGDEFGAILECGSTRDVVPAAAAIHLANRIIAAAKQPIEVGERRVEVGATIGIAISPDRTDADTMLKAADMAMYRAKKRAAAPSLLPAQHGGGAARAGGPGK